jgi:GT2 family glycosyltransferase
VVVDNGSSDGTMEFLSRHYAAVLADDSPEPLSFSRAANRGIERARFSHVCLLNNDMLVEEGFLEALRKPFDDVPDLFSSSAQIFFPEGQRRQETGKTVLLQKRPVLDLPLRCDIPLEGEDQSWVLYGSGGCTLYDARKLAALGNFDTTYEPAYVEDLDVGVRGWLAGWPSVYAAQARVLHKHRTTTSRYYTSEELDYALESNYALFLERAIPDRRLFGELWRENTLRLKANKKTRALEFVSRLEPAPVAQGSLCFLPLVNGQIAVFPGRPRTGKPVVLVASPYLPFPLSHGAAVRIFNLMRRAAPDFDQVLVAFVESPASVPKELLSICAEVITVTRPGTHALPSTARPDTVEEFDSPSFRAALRQASKKWSPRIAQLEFTQMAQYAADCGPAKTLLVEHDITYDLYAQMLARKEEYEVRRQYDRWVAFEHAAWTQVTRVVTMSEKDSRLVEGSIAIPNGVDLERFRPSAIDPDPRRLLFIGSFAHRPNVLAVEFFLRDVFPKLKGVTLHVIAGQRHTQFWDLKHPGVEVEGFVSDVRPAYERATLVIAPLVASAGTNSKLMEARAMGKAIVSTAAGIHGLNLAGGKDLIVEDDAEKMAAAISTMLGHPEQRRAFERRARTIVERMFGWDAIAREQKRLYEGLLA